MNSELIINQGLIEVLKKETDRLKDLNLFDLDYVVTGNPVFMDSQKELVIFRIIQEAFNNIIKHAGATSVKLSLEYNFDHINVLIADNGRGFCKDAVEQNKNKESSAGLNNMQKRAVYLTEEQLLTLLGCRHKYFCNYSLLTNGKRNYLHKCCFADDHILLRSALASLIDSFGDCKVIHQSNNGKELIDWFENGLVPDVAILDLNMPEMDGYEAAR